MTEAIVSSRLLRLVLVAVLLPAAIGWAALAWFSGTDWTHLPAHAVLEALGTFAVLGLAVFLVATRIPDERPHTLWVAAAMAAIGILNAFHAIALPGQHFIRLHVDATLAGGALMALAWVPDAVTRGLSARAWVGLAAVAALALGLLEMASGGLATAGMLPDGSLAAWVRPVSLLAGALFLAGAVAIGARYARTANGDELLLIGLALLFALDALFFSFTRPWDADWWTWHLIRLAAYVAVLFHAFVSYQRGQAEVLRARDELGARSAELAREVEARRKSEEALRVAAVYDETQRGALTLFNAAGGARRIVEGVLELLSRQHAFPVCAYYDYDEWRGVYRMHAGLGVPQKLAREVVAGTGLIGEAARIQRPLLLDGIGDEQGLTIDAGLFGIAPRAVMIAPVHYQHKRLGALVLLGTRAQSPRDVDFVDQLSIQLGVALYNLSQHENLRLLAGQLRERNEEVARKNRQLEEASRMKSEFLANMSHELRTPLNAIIGFAELMRDGVLGELQSRQRDPVTHIVSSGKHLLSLINEILDLSKIEAGHMTLELEPLDPCEMCRNSLAVVTDAALLRRIRIDADCGKGLPLIVADPRKLRQILYNLMSNAVKFTPEDGVVSLSMRRVPAPTPPRAGRYFPPAASGSEFLEIAVADSGIGIAAADLQRLFEPFVQLDSALSRKYQGTGLGLAMVRKLIELHGGALAAESTPGEGSRFTAWLPWREAVGLAPGEGMPAVAPRETLQPVPATPGEATGRGVLPEPGKAPLVLVVEDDEKTAALMRTQLEDAGYRVAVAASAEEALAMASAEPPDAISLDVMLPGMDGWELLDQLKRHEALAHVPVIIVSAVPDVGKGLALGATMVQQKPVSQQDLIGAMARVGLQTSRTASRRVLVVDDEPRSVDVMATHLAQAGFVVERAYGGAEAIDSVRSSPPDAVVLDLLMPDVSGFEVVRALKDDPATAGVPIVAITAKLLTAADRAALNGCVAMLMEKAGFRPEDFVREVRSALTAARAGADKGSA